MIKCLLIQTGQVLISEIEEVVCDIGEPDCKLINPFLISGDQLLPWMDEYTDQKFVLISSQNIITIVEPNKNLLEKYLIANK
jgi:hypothetical protein